MYRINLFLLPYGSLKYKRIDRPQHSRQVECHEKNKLEPLDVVKNLLEGFSQGLKLLQAISKFHHCEQYHEPLFALQLAFLGRPIRS